MINMTLSGLASLILVAAIADITSSIASSGGEPDQEHRLHVRSLCQEIRARPTIQESELDQGPLVIQASENCQEAIAQLLELTGSISAENTPQEKAASYKAAADLCARHITTIKNTHPYEVLVFTHDMAFYLSRQILALKSILARDNSNLEILDLLSEASKRAAKVNSQLGKATTMHKYYEDAGTYLKRKADSIQENQSDVEDFKTVISILSEASVMFELAEKPAMKAEANESLAEHLTIHAQILQQLAKNDDNPQKKIKKLKRANEDLKKAIRILSALGKADDAKVLKWQRREYLLTYIDTYCDYAESISQQTKYAESWCEIVTLFDEQIALMEEMQPGKSEININLRSYLECIEVKAGEISDWAKARTNALETRNLLYEKYAFLMDRVSVYHQRLGNTQGSKEAKRQRAISLHYQAVVLRALWRIEGNLEFLEKAEALHRKVEQLLPANLEPDDRIKVLREIATTYANLITIHTNNIRQTKVLTQNAQHVAKIISAVEHLIRISEQIELDKTCMDNLKIAITSLFHYVSDCMNTAFSYTSIARAKLFEEAANNCSHLSIICGEYLNTVARNNASSAAVSTRSTKQSNKATRRKKNRQSTSTQQISMEDNWFLPLYSNRHFNLLRRCSCLENSSVAYRDENGITKADELHHQAYELYKREFYKGNYARYGEEFESQYIAAELSALTLNHEPKRQFFRDLREAKKQIKRERLVAKIKEQKRQREAEQEALAVASLSTATQKERNSLTISIPIATASTSAVYVGPDSPTATAEFKRKMRNKKAGKKKTRGAAIPCVASSSSTASDDSSDLSDEDFVPIGLKAREFITYHKLLFDYLDEPAVDHTQKNHITLQAVKRLLTSIGCKSGTGGNHGKITAPNSNGAWTVAKWDKANIPAGYREQLCTFIIEHVLDLRDPNIAVVRQ